MLLSRITSLFRTDRRRRAGRGRVIGVAVAELEPRQLLSAVTAHFTAIKDTTIYTNEADLSNGQGEFVVASGASNGLVQFDVGVGAIPEGSVILDVVLTMHVGYSEGGTTDVSVQRVTSPWGEAASDAGGNETIGTQARQFDATWIYSSYDGEVWNTPGGDVAGPVTSTPVGDIGSYEWIGGGLIDDVQAWVDGVAANFGWLVEAGDAVKAFVSKDAPAAGLVPLLEVTYEAPPEPQGIVEGRIWNDLNTDGRPADPAVADLDLQIFQQLHFNAFGGAEYWFRSAGDQRWYFLTPDGRLTKWDMTGGELSGETVTTVDQRFYLDPQLMVQPVDSPEPWLNGRTVELLDSGGSVIATTTTSGRDINRDGSIDPQTEGGWYLFENVASDQTYTVRQVLPDGWKESARVELDLSTGTEDLVNGLGLTKRGSYFQNFGGENEKWLHSETHGWHYILPSGDLYRWDGRPISDETPLAGRLVASVGIAGYHDPETVADGNFREDDFTEGDLLMRVDFGTYLSQTVSGRVWLDFYANGEREDMTHLPENWPDYELQLNERWFYDKPNDDWYIINADGEPVYWGKSPDEGGNQGPPFTGSALHQIEPWLNNRIVELLDANGQVVAETTTRSIDLDNNGVIDTETERGHYVFADVAPGEYTIRTISDDDWRQTSPVTAAHSDAIRLDARYGFRQTQSDFLNWGGRNERWLIDSVGRWYYILPDGSLYEWTIGTGRDSQLEGTLIANLSTDYYQDISQLTAPDPTATTVTVSLDGVSDALLFGNHRLLSDLLTSAS